MSIKKLIRPYAPQKSSRSEFITIHGKRYHIRRWGNPDAPLLVMLHGWMDISATHQFLVDAFTRGWNIVAPDWSGYGFSEERVEAYYLTEYIADLDMLLEHFSPRDPVSIVAHSMGANIATIYAGARPERVSYVVNMEGLGPVPKLMKNTADMMAEWLKPQREAMRKPRYESVRHFADRLVSINSFMSMPKALFLAEQFTVQLKDGCFGLRASDSVRSILPMYPHLDQIIEVWSRVTAKVLFLRGSKSFISRAIEEDQGSMQVRIDAVANNQEIVFEGVSHNMQHEVPELIAEAIENFLP